MSNVSVRLCGPRLWGGWCLVIACLVVVVLIGGMPIGSADAETLQSNTYRFEESSIGAGGLVESGSANFKVRDAIGDTAVGASSSTNYQTSTGSKTTPDPTLSFSVTSGSPSFGSFSASSAAVATATFSVSNYTSYGYVVQVVGTAPSNGSKTLPALAAGTASAAGTEQFGMNLVANTAPASLGANPNQGQFGFGVAAPNYGSSNLYRFVSGETIASAPKSSGVTSYTISYIANVASLTPGGIYTSNQTLICTGTY